jgi:hypothetical protein
VWSVAHSAGNCLADGPRVVALVRHVYARDLTSARVAFAWWWAGVLDTCACVRICCSLVEPPACGYVVVDLSSRVICLSLEMSLGLACAHRTAYGTWHVPHVVRFCAGFVCQPYFECFV